MATLKNTTINDTGFLQLPVGTTAQRPSSLVAGMVRYNSTTGVAEYYNGVTWADFSSPSYITNGLVLYVDAGIAASYAGTGNTWTDLSPSGLNFTSAIGNPQFVTSASGSYFTNWGTSSPQFYWEGPTTFSQLPTGSANRTCIAIASTGSGYANGASYGHVLQYGDAVVNGTFSIAIYSGNVATHPWNGTPTDGGIGLNTVYMLTTGYVNSTGENFAYINTTFSSMGTRSISTNSTGSLRIGMRISTPTEGWNQDGRIYAVMIYNRVLSSSEITSTYNYFKGRGLPLA